LASLLLEGRLGRAGAIGDEIGADYSGQRPNCNVAWTADS